MKQAARKGGLSVLHPEREGAALSGYAAAYFPSV